MLRTTVSLAAVGAGLALALAATPAMADPVGTPTYRPLAGMGSDTTFEVMNGLSEVVVVGGQKVIGSYDPTPAGGIVSTKDEAAFANCNTTGGSGGVPRANGSSAGRDALNSATTAGNAIFGCLDFARTSSGSVVAGQTFVPMAQDGLTYAYPTNGDIGPASSLADLQLIYKCDPSVAGVFKPLNPQGGSGTRNSWATLMGISNTTLPACVSDKKTDGTNIQEHDGRVLTTSNSVVPFSVAQYLAQSFGVTPERRGPAQLGMIDSVSPLIQNPGQTTLRVVGNILPTATFSDPSSLANNVFVDNGTGKSQICVNGKSTIERYGFIASTC